MREWFDYDKDGAIEWALRMKKGQGFARMQVLGTVGFAWAMKDPLAASEWVMTLPEGHVRDRALGSVASRWAEKDPVAASGWAMKLPEGKNKDQLLNNVSIIPWIIG